MSLRDRVRTAAQLYKAGLTQRLLMSGAQGRGEPLNETSVMRTLAIGFGVPAAAIRLDPRGVNTDATVRDTVPVLRAAGNRRVAVVSDFFHLPRIKLAYQRLGYNVITVPSRAHRIPQTTRLVVREIPAFWCTTCELSCADGRRPAAAPGLTGRATAPYYPLGYILGEPGSPMATYDLVCLECGRVFEIFVQGFLKNEDRQCPSCGSFKTRQKFSPFLTNAANSSGGSARDSSGASGSGFG